MLFDTWMISACGVHTRIWSLENTGTATAVLQEEVVLLVISEVSGLKEYADSVPPSMLETMECITRSASAAAMSAASGTTNLHNVTHNHVLDVGKQIGNYTVERNRVTSYWIRRTVEMNSDDVVANNSNMMQHHVLEKGLSEGSILVEGIGEMITEGDMILR
jgi:hypothetical protein